jgi:hypothetical protein
VHRERSFKSSSASCSDSKIGISILLVLTLPFAAD